MAKGRKQADDPFDLGVGLAPSLDVDLDYQPEPPLDLDPRPVSGQEVKSWRKQARPPKGERHYNQPRYLTQQECAARLGVNRHCWKNFEAREEGSNCWSALIREFFSSGCEVQVEFRAASLAYLEALVDLVGSARRLAEALSLNHSTPSTWRKRGEVPRLGGAGPLVRWLCCDMRLDVVEEPA